MDPRGFFFVFVLILLFITRYMGPGGSWQRRSRCPLQVSGRLFKITFSYPEQTCAEELGIPYLSKATDPQAGEVAQVSNGIIYGTKYRPIDPFVVCHDGEARWIFFVVD